mmetsp:Transcript_2163/g.6468  ORF Transcript_2163/g.6468 Transcript_2163/m.6468 type:complete len:222 (+) Transcript_2163:967-1632(+)
MVWSCSLTSSIRRSNAAASTLPTEQNNLTYVLKCLNSASKCANFTPLRVMFSGSLPVICLTSSSYSFWCIKMMRRCCNWMEPLRSWVACVIKARFPFCWVLPNACSCAMSARASSQRGDSKWRHIGVCMRILPKSSLAPLNVMKASMTVKRSCVGSANNMLSSWGSNSYSEASCASLVALMAIRTTSLSSCFTELRAWISFSSPRMHSRMSGGSGSLKKYA